MARWPLLGGSYMAQSLIANAQRCVNLYPERNQQDAPVPVTHYSVPGTLQLVAGLGRGRGMFTASDGTWYGVSGSSVWWSTPEGVVTTIGSVPPLLSPMKFVDNSLELLLVDGTVGGAWTINLTTKAFALHTDSTTTFTGATMGAYLDTFAIFNTIGKKEFTVSLPNSFTFDGDVGSKTSQPDPLTGLATAHRELWLFGTKTTEIWTTVPDADFPFQIIPGAFVEYGCAAPYSITTADISVFWLAQNEEGHAMVVQGKGYEAKRISTHALENALQGYSTLADAQAFSYQENGHIFYVLNFPTADKTWAYDASTECWHERAWMDGDGALHRSRLCSIMTAGGKRFGQDWETGALLEVNSRLYTDNGAPILRLRSFPHLPTISAGDKKISLDGKRIKYHKFSADIEVGTSLLSSSDGAIPPQVTLRWSNTRGASWQGSLTQSLGATGETTTRPSFWRLGTAPDRIWELSWTANAPVALNGAWVELSIMKS